MPKQLKPCTLDTKSRSWCFSYHRGMVQEDGTLIQDDITHPSQLWDRLKEEYGFEPYICFQEEFGKKKWCPPLSRIFGFMVQHSETSIGST